MLQPRRLLFYQFSVASFLTFTWFYYFAMKMLLDKISPVVPHPLPATQGTSTLKPQMNIRFTETKKTKIRSRVPLTSDLYEPGFLMSNPGLCKRGSGNIHNLILITSALEYSSFRKSIRASWGYWRASAENIAMAFVVGRTLNSSLQKNLNYEQEMYGDIIQERNIDSYRNLTLKTISMLEWALTYCPNVKFLLKADDDIFINIPRLIWFLSTINSPRTIYGFVWSGAQPYRNKKSKYYVSRQEFSESVYPNYTAGPAYLLTGDIIFDLYNASLSNTTYLMLEDVFLTGIVASKLHVNRTSIEGFRNQGLNKPYKLCDVLTSVSIYYVSNEDKFKLYNSIENHHNVTKCNMK